MDIGLDVGNSGIKAALVNGDGEVIATREENYATRPLGEGLRELDPAQMLEAMEKCLRAVGDRREVRTITVNTLGECFTFTDDQGMPLLGMVLGTDPRCGEMIDELLEKVDRKRIAEITTQNPGPCYSLPGWAWFAHRQARLFKLCTHIHTCQSFLLESLCRAFVTDWTVASRTMAFDTRRRRWASELLQAAGVPEERLPRLTAPGTAVGELTNEWKKATGILGKPRVVAGCHDHIGGALGAGVYQPGDCAVPCGTTEGITAVMPAGALQAEDVLSSQIACQPFVIDGLEDTIAWQNTAGAMYLWYAKLLSEGPCVSTLAQLEREMPDAPTQMLVLPHFSGAATPQNDPLSLGAILGLTLETTRGELYRALLEGVALEDGRILACLEKAKVNMTRLVCFGGSARDANLQIKADMLRLPIDQVKDRFTGALGGAMLGMTADGRFRSVAEAAEWFAAKNASQIRRFYPAREDRYEVQRQCYAELYATLAPVNHRLAHEKRLQRRESSCL